MAKEKLQDSESEQKESNGCYKWKKAESFLSSKGYINAVPIWRDFYEGRHYGVITKAPNDIKNAKLNYCGKIVDGKIADLLATPIDLHFTSDSDLANTTRFNNFIRYIRADLQENRIDDEVITNAYVESTGIVHYYWSENANGKANLFDGKLRGQVISPLDFGVANPSVEDIQKQKWVVIRGREDVHYLRSICVDESKRKFIVPDDSEKTYLEDNELDDESFATMYTVYFRNNGTVYFQQCTKSVDLFEPRSLNPFLNEVEIPRIEEKEEDLKLSSDENEKYQIDPQVPSATARGESPISQKGKKFKFNLYPIALFTPKKRRNSIFGISLLEELIPNQIIINYNLTMIALNIQDTAWGKYVVKAKALNGQKITNTPAQVLVDYSLGAGWGITKMEGQQQLGNGVFEFSQNIMELTRDVTNSKEVITSNAIDQGASGKSLEIIQYEGNKANSIPLTRWKRFKEDCGRIYEQFARVYPEHKKFTYRMSRGDMYKQAKSDEQIKAEMNSGQELSSKLFSDEFNGLDYIETEFDLNVEAGQSVEYSQFQTANMLNSLLLQGSFSKMDTQTRKLFLELYPEQWLPVKKDLQAVSAELEESENAKLKQALQEAMSLLKESERTVQAMSNQIKQQSTYTKLLNDEYGKQLGFVESQQKAQDSAYKELINSQNKLARASGKGTNGTNT